MPATVVAPALLTELTKARRMIVLALRHDRTRRLLLLATVLYAVKRLARRQRKQRAADRLVREMLERERPASRVQSAVDLTAYSRQSTSRAGLPRSASRAVLTSMVHRHAPGQALCTACLSRCNSNASLATLADAADGNGSSDEEAADNAPQPEMADEALCCAVCTVEEAGWKKGVRRGGALLGGTLVAFILWLRLAPPALAREQIASIVEWLGRAAFDYRVANLETLPAAGPALIYCYHGFIPLDMYFFHLAVWRHTGRLPMTLVADFVFRIPIFGYIVRLCGGQPASREAALRQLRDGGVVILAPGGVREGMTTTSEDYALRWYGKQGFAELAARAGAPLVPMFTRNVRELFLVLGGNSDLVKWLYSLTRLPFTPFIGPMLLPLTSVLGPPLPHEPSASISAAAERATEALQALMLSQRRPGMPIGYADPKYWEALYSGHDREAAFEWYMSAQQLSPLLWPLLPVARPADVLEIGCGTQSLLPGLHALRAASFGRLLATDLSAAGIKKLAGTVDPAIECAVADCRSTGLAAASWDLILDKATCDALLTQGSPEKGHADVAALGREAARLLRPEGCLVVVTHAQPELHLCGDGEEPPPEHDARPLIDALLLGLCEGAPYFHWSVEAHVPDPDDCPRVLILRKRERRSSRGRRPPPMAARDVHCRLVEW